MKVVRYELLDPENRRILERVDTEINSVEELEKYIDKEKARFRKDNKTDAIVQSGKRDLSYERYCEELDRLHERWNRDHGL